jgi:hypothetical protein
MAIGRVLIYQSCHGLIFARIDTWRKPHPQPARPLIASAHAQIPSQCVEEAPGLDSQSRSHLYAPKFARPLLSLTLP